MGAKKFSILEPQTRIGYRNLERFNGFNCAEATQSSAAMIAQTAFTNSKPNPWPISDTQGLFSHVTLVEPRRRRYVAKRKFVEHIADGRDCNLGEVKSQQDLII